MLRLYKEQEYDREEVFAKDEDQISAEADLNHLPQSKRSLAGDGRRT
jgi:hypothetical protein